MERGCLLGSIYCRLQTADCILSSHALCELDAARSRSMPGALGEEEEEEEEEEEDSKEEQDDQDDRTTCEG